MPCLRSASTPQDGSNTPLLTHSAYGANLGVLTMTPVEWLLVELIVAPLLGGAMAYGIVLLLLVALVVGLLTWAQRSDGRQ